MSGYSTVIPCPNCGKGADLNGDTRETPSESVFCPHCGYYTMTTHCQSNLAELNEYRRESDMRPLRKLPKWTLGKQEIHP
jgi:uncharacterized Zn finger protein (UPF0148 family)